MKIIIIGFCLFLLFGCGKSSERPQPTEKEIVDKIQTVEQRLSFDPFDKESIRTRAETIFYLIADDGSVTEVNMKIYVNTKKGDRYSTLRWQRK